MPKPNLKCKICGKEYHLCQTGARMYPWLQIVCSPECWAEWNNQLENTKLVKVDAEAVEEIKTEATTKQEKKKTTK